MKRNTSTNLMPIFIIVILQWISSYCQNISGKFDKHRFIIAVLLPVHNIEYADYDQNIIRKGKLNINMVQLIEAAYYAKDHLEKNNNILSNITLDIVIKDYADFPRFGIKENDPKMLEELCWFGNWIKFKEDHACNKNDTISHLIGIIYSENVEDEPKFQNILQSLPLVPRISYSGPPKGILVNENLRLERGGKSRTFNTVSSGSIFVIDVVFEILKHYNWTYVALQYSSLSLQGIRYAKYEGIRYAKRFQDLADNNGICIAHVMDTESVLRVVQSEKALWQVIPSYNTVEVVICICSEIELVFLQTALIGNGSKVKKYLVIGVNGAEDVKEYIVTSGNFDPDLIHMYHVIPKQIYLESFEQYFVSRTVKNNQRNPWFKQLWEQEFHCKYEPTNEEKQCNGTEAGENGILRVYHQFSDVANMIKSVYTLALGLNRTLNDDNWQGYPDFWNKLRNHVNGVNFTTLRDEVSFNQDGLPRTEKFDILTMRGYYVKVGEYFRSGYHYSINRNRKKDVQSSLYYRRTLEIEGILTIYDIASNYSMNIRQSCSDPCPPGHATIKQNDICCWKCDPCNSLEILNDTSICSKCEHGHMSNDNKTACIPIPVRKSEWHSVENLISIGFSSISITLAIFTSIIFIKYRDTPAVKSTTPELCHVMFAGMVLGNITPFLFILSLDTITCAAIRFIPPISFTMIYAALLVKTNRIARLLAMSKKKFPNLNPKFMTLKAQVIITLALIGTEILICSIILYFDQPKSIIDYKEENNTWFGLEKCNLNQNILMEVFLFVAILVVLCTNYAIKTRNLPENFNEAKYIGFAMYATLLTGMAFALVYFNSEKKTLAINLSVSINSSIVLVFLFAPKIYIVLWKPERNTKTNFIITTDIRSYQGNEKRSNSKQQHSNHHQLKELKQQVNSAMVQKERMQNAIIKVLTELSPVLKSDEVVTKSSEIQKLEDVKESDIVQQTRAEMIEKVKSCFDELNRLQKEIN